jgi:hypothetical protein
MRRLYPAPLLWFTLLVCSVATLFGKPEGESSSLIDKQNMLPECKFEMQGAQGTWDLEKRSYTPQNCRLRHITPKRARQCMGNKTLAFIGDSNMRDFGMAVLRFLAGEVPSDASDQKFDKLADAEAVGARNRHRTFPDGRYKVRSVKKRLGRAYEALESTWSWKIEILNVNYPKDWPQIREVILRNATRRRSRRGRGRRRRPVDMGFIGLGVHSIWEKWRLDPMKYWVHGHTMQPFFDLWCTMLNRDTTPVCPLVWMSMNQQCCPKKELRWQHQCRYVDAGNNGSRRALNDAGLPYLNWADTVSGRSKCDTSDDGVHVKAWVDNVRAQILFGYLCDRRGRFRLPPSIATALGDHAVSGVHDPLGDHAFCNTQYDKWWDETFNFVEPQKWTKMDANGRRYP